MQNKSKKGFTLVEIMIVVVIIGLLAAMAIPAFQQVRENAVGKAMTNDARQLASGAQLSICSRTHCHSGHILALTADGLVTSPAIWIRLCCVK